MFLFSQKHKKSYKKLFILWKSISIKNSWSHFNWCNFHPLQKFERLLSPQAHPWRVAGLLYLYFNWCKFCIHFRSSNVRHFGTVAARGFRSVASRSFQWHELLNNVTRNLLLGSNAIRGIHRRTDSLTFLLKESTLKTKCALPSYCN
jgi:hypothetical protein